jgi:hypothetical protein
VHSLNRDRAARATATRPGAILMALGGCLMALGGCGEAPARPDPVPATARHRSMIETLCSHLAREDDAASRRHNRAWCLTAYRDTQDAEARKLIAAFRRMDPATK